MNRKITPANWKKHRLICPILLLLIQFVELDLVQHVTAQDAEIVEPGMVIFENPLKDLSIEPSNYRPVPGSGYLVNSNVFMQDNKGFIWLMWQGSLYRFDGYHLKEFEKVPTGIHDMNAHHIQAMAEDEFGYIWLGCQLKEGLYRYDPRKEKFERFPRHEGDPQEISDVSIWSISADMQGSVWIGTADYYSGRGLYRYDYSTDSFDEFREDPANPSGLASDDIHYVYADKFSNAWVVCNQNIGDIHPKGIYHYNTEDQLFRKVLVQVRGTERMGLSTGMIHEDGQGNLWLTGFRSKYETEGTLLKIPGPWENHIKFVSDSELLIEKFETYPAIRNCVKFDIDPEDKLWFTSMSEGIFRLDPSTGNAENYIPVDLSQEMYPWLFKIVCDNSGSVWYSYRIGIRKYVPGKRKFTVYDPSLFPKGDMDDDAVYSVYESENGTLWIGLRNTLVRMDPVTRKTRKFRPVDLQKLTTQSMRNRGNPLKAIAGGPDGNILVAGDNHLYILQVENEQFDSITYESASSQMGLIESYILVRDRAGKFWIGANPGALYVDLRAKTAKSILGDDRMGYFSLARTVDIAEDNRGMLWMGTELGMYRYDPVNDTSVAVLFNPELPYGLSEKSITATLMDREGNLWLGFQNGGIANLDAKQVEQPELVPESLVFSYLTTEDGLPDLHIHDLVEDHSGNIWIASRSNLSCFEPETRNIKVYTESDGIDILPFTSKFFISERTGKIYIGGANGLLSFDPDSIPVNPYVPPVVITELKLHDMPVSVSDSSFLDESIIYTSSLDLSHDQNFLEFTFAALDYTDPIKNNYKYFMDGVDPDTVYAGTDRTAEYRNMKPGNYTFWVTGSNNDGIWNQDGTTLQIRIRPPWYRSPLASGTYALLALLLVAGIIWWRTARLQKEKLLLEAQVEERTKELRQKTEQILEMEQLKTRFFTDVSHEIRTPLTLIDGPLDNLIRKEYPDEDTNRWLKVIRRNSRRLLNLVNQLLDISRLDAGQMKLVLRNGDVLKHLRILVQEYSSLAESRHIKLISDFPEGVLVTWYDREKMEKVVTNLLSNAFKYTPDYGIITYRIKSWISKNKNSQPFIRIMVADTGPGIPENERERIFERFYRSREEDQDEAGGTGIGLSLTRELTGLMGGEIYVRSTLGKGTVFIVTVPLGKDHLAAQEYVLKGEEEQMMPVDELIEKEQPSELLDFEKGTEYEVLIVEDNADLRSYILESLSDEYTLIEAEDGTEGHRKAIISVPDLVISDIMMPGMDGVELCDKLKTDERTSHVPVILLTAKSTQRDRIEGLETGADDYISKPFNMNELKVRIRNLLDQREKLKQKYLGMVGLDWNQLSVTTLDEKFLKKITEVISERMHDSEFNVEALQDEMAMSRVNLYRKLKALTGDTPSGLIRTLRLKTAAVLLEKGDDNIIRVALETGFSSSSVFAHAFRKEYGMTPGEYRKQRKQK